MSKLIVLSTGGTGGHVFPAQALAEELRERGYRLALITDRRGDAYSGTLGSLETHMISAAGVTGKGVMAKIKAALKLGLGYLQARGLLKRMKPAAVIGFGGYPSVPTMMAATRLPFRTVIHEQNAVLGRANRLLAPRVDRIALSFEDTTELREDDRTKAIWTGNPVRPEIAALAGQPYAHPGPETTLSILVTGGSQGAAIFGDVLPPAIALLPDQIRNRIVVTQQVRKEQLSETRAAYAHFGIQADLRPFLDDMPVQLRNAHLTICRAGASTMAELTTAARPAILVPYQHAADDHQSANAARLCDAAGAWMIPQQDFNAQSLSARMKELLEHPVTLSNAARSAARLGMPEATSRLADLVADLVGDNGNGHTGAPDNNNEKKEAAA